MDANEPTAADDLRGAPAEVPLSRTAMSGPGSPPHVRDTGGTTSGSNEGNTPTPKTKEKKRVGFSSHDGTPFREEAGFSWETAPTAPAEPPTARRHEGGGDDGEEGRGDHSYDGVDHNELTRALSLILQQEKKGGGPGGGPGSGPGGGQGAGPSETGPSSASGPSVPRMGHLQPPNPTYVPPERLQKSERAAKERADRLAQSVERANSTPVSRAASVHGDSDEAEETEEAEEEGRAASALYLRRRRPTMITPIRPGAPDEAADLERGDNSPELDQAHATALRLVRTHAALNGGGSTLATPSDSRNSSGDFQYDAALSATAAGRSGVSTPHALFDHEGHDYVPPPARYHGGVLSSLLRLYNNNNNSINNSNQHGSGNNSGRTSAQTTPAETPASSRPGSRPSSRPGSPNRQGGASTPKRLSGLFNIKAPGAPGAPWKSHKHSQSTTSLSAGLLGTASVFAATGSADIGAAVNERVKRERPALKRNRPSATSLFGVGSPKSRKEGGGGGGGESNGRRRRREEEIRITVHIAHVLSRHRYLTKLCRALMMYGAPTHRLEDYLKMSARVLEIEAQFLYIPGCMLVSFDDSTTHTAEVKLVRAPQGVDLGKLHDVHGIYKEVVHDLIGVDEASARLDTVLGRRIKFRSWIRVPVYGLASVCVAPFAFEGRFIDLPIAFVLGCIVGLLALVAAPSNAMYSNVFEISAALITSFLARAAGSIDNGNLFCFSALAQSSIALILPGYMVLCASLELQSQNIVAGSVRMVYAMIYTLFLGYGITIGSAVYGAIDSGATSNTSCQNPLGRPWYFLFVPLFTLCLCIINQAKWKQIPIMLIISVAGFAVNTYASLFFSSNAQIPNTLGALCIGVCANLYARLSRYVERYTLLFWVRYLEPVYLRLARRVRRRQRWHGLGSASNSRRGSAAFGRQDGYYDLPPYRGGSRREADGGDRSRGDGDRDAPDGERSRTGSNATSTDTDADKQHYQPTAHGEAVVAEVAAETAAAAAAERKAPGSAEVMGYGLAAAAMLPAIFVQVPSGLAVNGSLLSGIDAADQLTGNSTVSASTSTSSTSNSVAFTVLYSVIQVAVGITVGLFLSALIVYPLGKRRSALFSF